MNETCLCSMGYKGEYCEKGLFYANVIHNNEYICLIFYIFHKIMPFEQRFNFLDLNDVNKIVKSLH